MRIPYLLAAATAVLAQSNQPSYPSLEEPQSNDEISSSNFTVKWWYNYDYDGDFTIALVSNGAPNLGFAVYATTVPATLSSTELPLDMITDLEPESTTLLEVWVYTSTLNNQYGDAARTVTFSAPGDFVSATATSESSSTETGTETDSGSETPGAQPTDTLPMPAPSATGTGAGEEDEFSDMTGSSSDSGPSKGAEIGFGVGVAVGGLLIIGAIVIFIWRRRRSREPKTIREISRAPGSAAFLNSPGSGSSPSSGAVLGPGLGLGGGGGDSGSANGSANGSGSTRNGHVSGTVSHASYGYGLTSPSVNRYPVSSLSGNGHSDTYVEGRPVSLPLALSPLTPSGSARPSPDRERFELPGGR